MCIGSTTHSTPGDHDFYFDNLLLGTMGGILYRYPHAWIRGSHGRPIVSNSHLPHHCLLWSVLLDNGASPLWMEANLWLHSNVHHNCFCHSHCPLELQGSHSTPFERKWRCRYWYCLLESCPCLYLFVCFLGLGIEIGHLLQPPSPVHHHLWVPCFQLGRAYSTSSCMP